MLWITCRAIFPSVRNFGSTSNGMGDAEGAAGAGAGVAVATGATGAAAAAGEVGAVGAVRGVTGAEGDDEVSNAMDSLKVQMEPEGNI